MDDINFHAAGPGDVCNHNGDLRGISADGTPIIISSGEVMVSPEQAVFAAGYGWEILDRGNIDAGEEGLATIRR